MNLFHHFLHLLSGSSKKPAAPVRNEFEPNNCEYLLSNLQRICAMLPDGEASVVMGRNKLDICLTWDTAMQANADSIKKNKEFQFWLNGKSEVVEWAETQEKETAKTEPVVQEEVAEKETVKPIRQQLTMRRLLNFLQLHYAFRYNRLTDRAECAVLNTESTNQDSHQLTYRPGNTENIRLPVINCSCHNHQYNHRKHGVTSAEAKETYLEEGVKELQEYHFVRIY